MGEFGSDEEREDDSSSRGDFVDVSKLGRVFWWCEVGSEVGEGRREEEVSVTMEVVSNLRRDGSVQNSATNKGIKFTKKRAKKAVSTCSARPKKPNTCLLEYNSQYRDASTGMKDSAPRILVRRRIEFIRHSSFPTHSRYSVSRTHFRIADDIEYPSQMVEEKEDVLVGFSIDQVEFSPGEAARSEVRLVGVELVVVLSESVR